MRVKGKIIFWNDEKGFGFVKPSSGEQQVFVHVSDFENSKRQPKIKQLVSYIVSKDKLGRTCGKSVLLDGDKLYKNQNIKSGLFPFAIVASFSIFAVQSFYFGRLQFLILAFYVIVSSITFIVYSIDKSAAIKGRWRIAESKLHLFSLLGGWPGAVIAQQSLRHKSKKQSFRFVFWITVLLNLGMFAWIHTPDGAEKLQNWIWKSHSFISNVDGFENLKVWLLKLF